MDQMVALPNGGYNLARYVDRHVHNNHVVEVREKLPDSQLHSTMHTHRQPETKQILDSKKNQNK